MSNFWHHIHKSSTDSITSITGFHDGYIYKIINQYDESVIHLENYSTTPGSAVTTSEDKDTNNDCQRFKTLRIREGEEGGEFEVQSILQNPDAPVQVWEYRPDSKTLVQNTAASGPTDIQISVLPAHSSGTDLNQLWVATEKSPESRVYFIKPKSEDVCLTNMGIGQPLALYPMDTSDLTQHWVLEPTDYTE